VHVFSVRRSGLHVLCILLTGSWFDCATAANDLGPAHRKSLLAQMLGTKESRSLPSYGTIKSPLAICLRLMTAMF
jgi:hypothetical protein